MFFAPPPSRDPIQALNGTVVVTWLRWFESLMTRAQPVHAVESANRPVNPPAGFMMFDTTLGQPIWWDEAATDWVDADGNSI